MATSKGSQMLILMNMADNGGAMRVVMCGIDDRKDRYLVLLEILVIYPIEIADVMDYIPVRCIDSIGDNGEKHCLCNPLAASDADEQ